MRQIRKTLAVLVLALAPGAAMYAQDAAPGGLVTQRILSLAMAKTIAETALAECKAKGAHSAVVVVDRAGQVLVVLRDEQAGPETVDMARRKAYTARVFHVPSLEFRESSKGENAGAGLREVPDILAAGGGVPIKIGNETIGGVGSSGSGQENDDACAKAGIAKVANLLK